jgi:dipeptidyl aminopeptidase/acylaminoacyl peptidase/pSer/pThr/pTyr-binding forkhead associated (FHA) protein
MPAPIVAEDLYLFRWLDHVRLTRDGERVAYQISWPDWASRQNQSRIVVRRLLDPEPLEPTAGPRRDHSPEWSPDGRMLAFISKVGSADQLFVVDVATGVTRQLSAVPEGASSPAWSPDGKWIAFVGTVLSDPDAVVDDPRPPESRDQVRRAPIARVVRRLDYKHDGSGFVDGRYHHLFVVSVSGGDATQLTWGAWDAADFDWSPESNRLVVAGDAEPGADLRRELNLYLVDLDGTRQLLGGGYYLSSPIWSPRGDQIAFIAPNGLDAGLIERLWVVSMSGGGPRCLTAELDLAVNDTVINDMRAGHDTRIAWSSEGDRIFFLASSPGATGIYSVDLEGTVRQEVGGQRRAFDFDVASGVLAFAASDATNPGELHMLTQGAEARLTDLNPWLRDRYIAEPEQHYFTAPDGWKLEGWVLKPQDLDPGRLYPMVMEIHGGPHSQYGWSFFHELQVLAGMGYVVFYMNPRGSDGYGERFRSEVVRDWGGKDYLDLMSALDQIIERTGYLDKNRMGVGGGSYGGYMTNWIIGQTPRFSAAVAMRSLSNLVSEYAQHDIVLWGTLELGPPPWPDLDELWRRSPIRYVENVRTPLLLTCGEMDLRTVIGQSEEMFGALRLLGKTVEFVRFPEETHDISRIGRPDRRVERLRRIANWYARFLGTASVDRASEEATQILTIPVDPTREWAKTTGIDSGVEMALASEPASSTQHEVAAPHETAAEGLGLAAGAGLFGAGALSLKPEVEEPVAAVEPLSEPEPVGEPEPAEEPAQAGELEAEPELTPAAEVSQPEPWMEEPEAAEGLSEPDVIKPEVPETVTSEAELVEPEALPDLPEPEPVEAEAAEPEPEAVLAEAAEPEPEPAEAQVEPEEAEPAMAEAAEPEPEPVEAQDEPEEPQPVAAEAEEPESEPEVSEAEEPLEPAAAGPFASSDTWGDFDRGETPAEEPAAPEAEPEPVGAAEPVSAASTQPPAQGNEDVRSTMVAWPSTNPPRSTNGSPSQAFDEATSVIPAWQNPDSTAQSKRTVSLQAVPTEQVTSGSAIAALLTFETGPFAGRIVAVPSQMITVGRAPDNDVVVGDPATSGHHGRIDVRGGTFWISDLGSTNGTLVNGEPVIETQLSDGDLISVGQSTIRFTLEA